MKKLVSKLPLITMCFPIVYFISFSIWEQVSYKDHSAYWMMIGAANHSLLYIMILVFILIIIWLIQADLILKKILYFFLGLLSIALNTFGLAFVNEDIIKNGGYIFSIALFIFPWIVSAYVFFYLLILLIKFIIYKRGKI